MSNRISLGIASQVFDAEKTLFKSANGMPDHYAAWFLPLRSSTSYVQHSTDLSADTIQARWNLLPAENMRAAA
jgi:hypothetical protein